MSGLSMLFIGESLVLAGAIEQAQRRGHRIAGIFALNEAEAEAMTRAGLPVAGPKGDVADFVASHDCDLLFSIINGHILDEATLAWPRIAAINYHNAPLPFYAGLRAPAWALLNGEVEHGVTWHRIDKGIDTGAILVQRRFPLAADETTASLSARCTVVALESFEELLDAAERGKLGGRAQDLGRRTYYGQKDVAPNGGLIDWRWPAEQVLRLVRACDWGPLPSDFGKAGIAARDGEAFVVRSAVQAPGQAAPGTVLEAQGDTLVIACGEGAVRLMLDRRIETAVGEMLPLPDPEALPASLKKPVPVIRQNGSTIVEAIAGLAAADPDAPAIEEAGRISSRAELASRSEAIAAALLAAGLRRDGGVGILLPAGGDFVAAALGTMRARGAYVPMDPASPLARHAVEIEEAGITHIVTSKALAAAIDRPGVVLVMIDEPVPVGTRALPMPRPGDCAYRIFTSGSTGRPKAVEVGHAALVNLAAHYRSALPMRVEDRMTMLAHPTFDASVADIWPVLAAGGTLLVPPPRILLDAAGLIDWLATSRATCAFVPTAVAERLIVLPWPARLTLRTLLTGGDALHSRPPPGLLFRLINTYGPTENTVDSLWATIGPGSGRPSIGRPIAGVTAAVIDAVGQPTPAGKVGELVLGGAQVARGYCGRPELTGKSFERDPSSPHGRRYRTGDLVRIGANGEFEFHGRIDNQVQLLGVRVEPGEIEALLKSSGLVGEVACIPLREAGQIVGLVVHAVPAEGTQASEELRSTILAFLEDRLPPAIVPRRIELGTALPHTAAGKIDRLALANLIDTADAAPPAAEDDPLRAIWLRLLPAAAGAKEEESFWDLGGDSLGLIELLLEIDRQTGVRVAIGPFLADPTLAGLRREIVARRDPIVLQLRDGKGPPLVLWYGVSGDLEDYQHFVPHLSERKVIGVRSPALGNPAHAADTIEELAAAGLASLRQFGIFEPPALFGYSWSGLLAFEAARQLTQEGMPPPLVALVGSLPPFPRRGYAARLAHVLRSAPKVAWRMARRRQAGPQDMRSTVRRLTRLFGRHGDLPAKPDWAKQPLQEKHLRIGKAYRPEPILPIDLHLFRELELREKIDYLGYVRYDQPDLGWSKWAGTKPQVTWIDGDHANVMKGTPVATLAALVSEELDRLG